MRFRETTVHRAQLNEHEHALRICRRSILMSSIRRADSLGHALVVATVCQVLSITIVQHCSRLVPN